MLDLVGTPEDRFSHMTLTRISMTEKLSKLGSIFNTEIMLNHSFGFRVSSFE